MGPQYSKWRSDSRSKIGKSDAGALVSIRDKADKANIDPLPKVVEPLQNGWREIGSLVSNACKLIDGDILSVVLVSLLGYVMYLFYHEEVEQLMFIEISLLIFGVLHLTCEMVEDRSEAECMILVLYALIRILSFFPQLSIPLTSTALCYQAVGMITSTIFGAFVFVPMDELDVDWE